MYITAGMCCFYLQATLHQQAFTVPLSLPFRTIVAVNKGKSGNMIRVVAETDAAEDDDDAEQSQYIFTEFDDAEAVDSALGLLEQMCEEAQEEGEGAS